ncbi:DUF192 domain-containing protein [Heliobacterium chlorum]|uniref:DUF192 domain-containing protein n=2 Tax=Heliobacterium chlorum TaxID=2698 RepID=A0ABR7T3G1_HELCL|nr:DUF192 domain-containing protein [Heliobacterium chlorum]
MGMGPTYRAAVFLGVHGYRELDIWVTHATSVEERQKGLLGEWALPPERGLLLTPCSQIHTVGMAFPIDVIYLTSEGYILDMDIQMVPGKWGRLREGCDHCLELSAGRARALGLLPGMRLVFLPI